MDSQTLKEYKRLWYMENKERISEENKQWRKDHPEESKEKDRIGREKKNKKNPDRSTIASRKFRLLHPERDRELKKNYVSNHPEKRKETSKKYRAANKDKRRIEQQNRRAKKINSGGAGWSRSQEVELKDCYNNRCAYCGDKTKLTIDHIVPLSSGGVHSIENTAPACNTCNTRKGTKSLLSFLYQELNRQ